MKSVITQACEGKDVRFMLPKGFQNGTPLKITVESIETMNYWTDEEVNNMGNIKLESDIWKDL